MFTCLYIIYKYQNGCLLWFVCIHICKKRTCISEWLLVVGPSYNICKNIADISEWAFVLGPLYKHLQENDIISEWVCVVAPLYQRLQEKGMHIRMGVCCGYLE